MFGVRPHNDFSVVQDLYCSDTYWGQPMFPCTDMWKTAYHPLKTLDTFTKCLHESGMEDTSIVDDIKDEKTQAVGGHQAVQGKADASGKVKRWKQCGGTDYAGPSECEAP